MSDLRDIATLCKKIDCLTAQVDTLRKERDEARRNVCYAESNGRIGRRGTAQGYAKLMGWDCFKEETP
jgi:hypothetical protein